ncbi:E3 ubiquitin-protein ligase MYLIP [Anthonomus grandis grandis]|uniref:E3 ubiquitin-protein ligase MYLIP n=1 Tax=Anthonomus grandis grandis TaxID=2921223 RepID=UPI0021669B0C|nr:E3 ubiquitin-protein ligase MYLIP [Anthonomus grandis grandis]
MWCLISQANSVVFEVRVDPKSIGQECLEKICSHLGISNESDYFGLKYENARGEELWLNLRNPIDKQVNCHNHTAPLRFALRVKFWVPPHLLLQETTRHQFYLHARSDLIEKRLLTNDWDGVCRVIALIAQAESEDYDSLRPPHNLYMQASTVTSDCGTSKPTDLLQRVIYEHKKLKGMKRTTAEYWLLKEIADFESFGEEVFTKTQGNIYLGVGPHGITIYDKQTLEKQLISFTNIVCASSHRRIFKLEYFSCENKETVLEVKLDSSHNASSLYRAITEKHAFYSCETVRSAVTTQFIRDLKGTIVSIFNEDSTLGKKYVFDIRRTCREVYDNARRAIYQESQARLALEADSSSGGSSGCDGEQCKDSEKLARFMEAMTCKICMDNRLDSVFMPCAHVVACSECASKIDRCPLCRSEITQAQKLYMPTW